LSNKYRDILFLKRVIKQEDEKGVNNRAVGEVRRIPVFEGPPRNGKKGTEKNKLRGFPPGLYGEKYDNPSLIPESEQERIEKGGDGVQRIKSEKIP